MQVRGRVLSVASECVPLIKTGGLADVVGALPAALRPLGWEMRVLMPAYRRLRGHLGAMREVWREPGLWGGDGVVFVNTGGAPAIYQYAAGIADSLENIE